jgi:lysophospholipase L1-like esterase
MRFQSSALLRLAAAIVIMAAGSLGACTLAEGESAPRDFANTTARTPFPGGRFTLERNDVVAFLGGADVAVAQHTGHLETLLAAKYRGLGVRFRNFGWEGDTVYAQPRDFGFPPLKAHLQRAQASVIVIQFGRNEALRGRSGLPGFTAAYEKLLDACAQQTPRIVLVTPPPFEKAGELLPDLTARNSDLAGYAGALRGLTQQRGLPLVDLFSELGGAGDSEARMTDDGLQFTPRGHALIARAFARQLGFGSVAETAGEPDNNGVWPNAAFERLRQAIMAKNRLWFDYWRPQNWAFLGGDRTSQPSSRDHRDPKVRWFPQEMERFTPLIEAKERAIAELAEQIP